MQTRRSILQGKNVRNTTNASLWLCKFIAEQKGEDPESGAKQKLVNEVSDIKVPEIYERFFNDIWQPQLEQITGKKFLREIDVEGRMIVGLGTESVLETSITLHRTYGIPFIPGSSLKGLAASYAHRFMGTDWKKQTRNAAIGKAHELMFGSQDSAGYVIFHDALYIPSSWRKNPKNPLVPDILTVHHQKYYQGENLPPADWDSPIPIFLLSAQGKYLLAVSANSGDEKFDKKIKSLAIDILDLALSEEGIGAKTSSGYGRASFKELALSEEEKREKRVEAQGNKLEEIARQLAAIGNYERENRDKFKDIVKGLRKFEPNLKKQGAKMVVEKVRTVSGKDDDELLGAKWFEEVKLMME
ncbi:MAG TPA: type III-B CRISPR module RAMP protein Cmr6 [Pyrinomonadaceae bacterium]|jgi:CRISPR-associated protein Cmr6